MGLEFAIRNGPKLEGIQLNIPKTEIVGQRRSMNHDYIKTYPGSESLLP